MRNFKYKSIVCNVTNEYAENIASYCSSMCFKFNFDNQPFSNKLLFGLHLTSYEHLNFER